MTAIRVELELQDGSFSSGLLHAGESVQHFRDSVGRGITSISRMTHESEGLMSVVRDLTVTLAVAGHAIHNLESVTTSWAGEIVHINAEFERMTALMRSLSSAADPVKEAVDVVSALREQAKNAPFSLQAMHDSFIRLKSSGLDPMNGSMQALIDGVAAFGGNDQVLQRASLALQEMAGKGVVQMKELRNQLGMAIPNAIPLLARAMGVSYQELMSDIHTGTVNAKAAIDALNSEFDRTFGGAAVRQMQTFNGQMARMQVLIQDLAIKNVGGAGYFDAVKSQITDFNNFLEGSTAAGLGNMLGGGLTTIVVDLRKALDTVVEFKNEIAAAGEMLLYAFGAKFLTSVVGGAVGGFRSMATEVRLLGVAYEVMSDRMRAASLMNSTMMMGAPMMSGWTAGIQTAGAAVGFLGTAVSTIVPWLMILGPAIGFVAEYFGLFHNKAEEAYVSLEKFGARTREEAKAVDIYVAQLDSQINALERLKTAHDAWMKDQADPNSFSLGGAEPAIADDDELARLKKTRADAESKRAAYHKQGLDGDTKTKVDRQVTAMEEVFRSLEAMYHKSSNDAQKDYDLHLKALTTGHKSTVALTAQYAEGQRERALALYAEEEKALDRIILRAQEMKKSKDELTSNEGQQLEDLANAKLSTVMKAREAERTRPLGVQLDAKVLDEQKLFEKGQEALAKINDEISGFSAGIEGMDPKVAEFQSRLSRGFTFGDIGLDRVKELIDQMVKARGEADALNDAMKGKTKLDHDLQSLRESLAERKFKAQYGDLSETDQLIMKINTGMYKGVGPNKSAIEKTLEAIKDGTRQADQAAQGLGATLADKAFGGRAKTAADAMIEVATRIGQAFGMVGAGVAKIAFPLAPTANGFGVSGPASGDYFDRLIKRESSGNPNAGASNPAGAVGLGQFMLGTWGAFMSSQHPELAGKGDLRTDPTLAKEAIQWYTAQNAQGLSKAGFDPNDANLYAAHFLGAGGARRALSGDPSTMFASDPYFAKAVAANPTILGGGATYGSVLAQFQAQFGTGHSGTGNGMPRLATPDGLWGNQGQQLADAGGEEVSTKIAENARKLKDAVEKNLSDAQKTADQFDETRKHWADARARIASGEFGTNKDPNAKIYTDLLNAADKADGNDKTRDDNKKARSKADQAAETARKAIQDAQTEHDTLWAQMNNPGSLNATSEMLRLKKNNVEQANSVKAGYGADSQQYKDILAQGAAAEDAMRNNEITKTVEGLQKKTASLRESLMTQENAQEDAYNREVTRIDKELAAFTGSEEEKLRLVKMRNDYISAYAAKQADQTPLGREFKQWGDLTKTFQQNTANWLNSTTDSLAELVTTGKTNWASLSQSITKDIVKMGMQWGIGSIGGSLKGGMRGGMGKLFGSAAGGGGILGAGHNATGDNNFAGGFTWVGEKGPELVNLPGGSDILPANSVPAMARQGADSMPASMSGLNVNAGGNHQYNITVAPTLQANGGNPEQNKALADQMAQHVEQSVRRVMADETRRQMRPGGMLDGRNFT